MIYDIGFYVVLNIIFFTLLYLSPKKGKMPIIAVILYILQLISFSNKCITNDFIVPGIDFQLYSYTTAMMGYISFLIGYYISLIIACVLLFISYKKDNKSKGEKNG